jgi:hypothetical protein
MLWVAKVCPRLVQVQFRFSSGLGEWRTLATVLWLPCAGLVVTRMRHMITRPADDDQNNAHQGRFEAFEIQSVSWVARS